MLPVIQYDKVGAIYWEVGGELPATADVPEATDGGLFDGLQTVLSACLYCCSPIISSCFISFLQHVPCFMGLYCSSRQLPAGTAVTVCV